MIQTILKVSPRTTTEACGSWILTEILTWTVPPHAEIRLFSPRLFV